MIRIDEKELKAVPERIFTTPLPRPDTIRVFSSAATEREKREARIDRALDGILSVLMCAGVMTLAIQAACYFGL